MIAVQKPNLLNLNIYDVSQKVRATTAAAGRSMYHSVKNATAEDVKEFSLKAGTNIAAGALTKAFVVAVLAGTAPTVVTVGATALAVGAVSTKITHWRDCKKAIANNEEPPAFNWKNYGLKGLFSSAMVGFGAFFSEQILNLFTPTGASAQTLPVPQLEGNGAENVLQPVIPETVELPPVVEPVVTTQPVIEEFVPPSEPAPEVLAQPVLIEPVAPEVEVPEFVQPAEVSPIIDVEAQSVAPVEVTDSVQAIEIVPEFTPLEPIVLGEPLRPVIEAVDIEAPAPLAAVEPDVIEPIELSAEEELLAMELSERGDYALQAHISGNAQGTADLGYFYFHGEQGLPQDYERAVEFYRDAAEQGNRFAVRDLAYVENQAQIALAETVPEITTETPEPAVVQPAPEVSAEIVAEPVVEEAPVLDPAPATQPVELTAIEELQAMDLGARAQNALEGHINGDVQSTADLGYFYFHGEQGLPQDYERAVEFYREAAEQGNRFAIRDLAYIEMQAEKALGYPVPEAVHGEAVPETPDMPQIEPSSIEELQALDLRARAESALEAHINGNAQGTADLGYYYFHGYQGVPQDLEKAVEFYREAALNGNGYAIRDLAFVEQEALKAGIALDDFELPEHLYEKSAPAIPQANTGAAASSNTVRSGMRASCAGDLYAINGSRPQLQFDCSVRGNHAYIYPGEHVRVSLPNGASHVFNLDAAGGRQPVNDFLQNSVLPAATEQFVVN